jgi:hypothetical protein
MDLQRNFEERPRQHFSHIKAIITHSDCFFVASVIRPEKRMRHILLSSVGSLALPYIFYIILKTTRFSGNVIEHKMRVSVFFTTLKHFLF